MLIRYNGDESSYSSLLHGNSKDETKFVRTTSVKSEKKLSKDEQNLTKTKSVTISKPVIKRDLFTRLGLPEMLNVSNEMLDKLFQFARVISPFNVGEFYVTPLIMYFLRANQVYH